jgi:hypothetical protein
MHSSPSTESVLGSRYRGSICIQRFFGSIPRAARFDVDERVLEQKIVAEALGAQPNVLQHHPRVSTPPLCTPQQAAAPTAAALTYSASTEDFFLCLGQGMAAARRQATAAATAAAPRGSFAQPDDSDWGDVELCESKEDEPGAAPPLPAAASPPPPLPPPLTQPAKEKEPAPAALVYKLKHLGLQRALEAALLGRAITPASFALPLGGAPAPDPTLAIRCWPTGPTTIAPHTRCLSTQQLFVLACNAYKRKCEERRLKPTPLAAKAVALAPPATAMAAAPRPATAGDPGQARAASNREAAESAARSRAGHAAARAAAAAEAALALAHPTVRSTGRPSAEAEWAKSFREAAEEKLRKARAVAEGRVPRTALQAWREEQRRGL